MSLLHYKMLRTRIWISEIWRLLWTSPQHSVKGCATLQIMKLHNACSDEGHYRLLQLLHYLNLSKINHFYSGILRGALNFVWWWSSQNFTYLLSLKIILKLCSFLTACILVFNFTNCFHCWVFFFLITAFNFCDSYIFYIHETVIDCWLWYWAVSSCFSIDMLLLSQLEVKFTVM